MSSKSRTPAPPLPEAGPLYPSRRAFATLRAALELSRPHNCAIAFLSVLLGGWLGAHAISPPLLLAALSAALIMGAGNSHNDLCDIGADRINRPDRPLPSGRLPVRVARLEVAGLAVGGTGLALILPSPLPALALCAGIGLALYNTWLKRVPLVGNLLVGLLCALAFFYGGAAVHAPRPAFVPALFVLLFHLGREILKDVEDSDGDRILSGTTLPLRFGRRKAYALVTAIFLLLVLSTPLPVLTGHYGLRYLALVLLLNALLIYTVFALWRSRRPANLRRLNRLLKIGMLIGLCAIFIDSL